MPPRAVPLLSFLLALSAGCGPDTTWRPAFDASESGWLMNVWGLGDDHRIAVGGSFSEGRAVHHDGVAWTEREVPAAALLNWVYGFAEDDVWAVGSSGTILRWDGSAWTEAASPTDQDLWGVWGASSDDVWAVGGTALSSSPMPRNPPEESTTATNRPEDTSTRILSTSPRVSPWWFLTFMPMILLARWALPNRSDGIMAWRAEAKRD